MKRLSLLLAVLLSLLACPLHAQSTAQDPGTLPEVKAAETYLSSIKTLKARFTQVANDGQKIGGDFYLKRPGRMRFQYDPPVTDFIVADGIFVHYYDGQLKQHSNTLISRSLADFFLRKNFRLPGEDLRVSSVKRAGGLLHITLEQAKDPLAGSLTLMFAEKPAMQLKKWMVIDPQGAQTLVELSDVQEDVNFDSDLFKYYDPEQRKVKYN